MNNNSQAERPPGRYAARQDMFTIHVELRNGSRSAVAPGARRALYELRRLRELYGVEPTVTDGKRSYTEADLLRLC